MRAREASVGAAWRTGAPPGVYERVAARRPRRDVRMDVAAFVGLTERGPVSSAVAVNSWSEFVANFGRPGGGRSLPDAVRCFFANGGDRAVVVRVVDLVHATAARLTFSDDVMRPEGGAPPTFVAADPGAWGDALRASWRWVHLPPLPLRATGGDLRPVSATAFDVLRPLAPPVGALLRHVVRRSAGVVSELVTFVRRVDPAPSASGFARVELTDPLLVAGPGEAELPLEELRGELRVWAGDMEERHPLLGLDPSHPRALAVALAESRLLRADDPLVTARVRPPPLLRGETALPVAEASGGAEGVSTLTRHTFFDAGLPPGAVDDPRRFPLAALDAYDATHETEPVSLVAMPDLLHPLQPPDPRIVDEPVGDTRFGACATPDAEVSEPAGFDWPGLTGLVAPPVGEAQAALVDWCERRGGLVAILDAPPGMTAGQLLRWRSAHASMRAAAFGPYLQIADEDPDGPLRTVPPCGAVCGLVARRDRADGAHRSPANQPLVGVVGLAFDPMQPDAGILHEARVNALRATERGLRLMGSRTTSLDPEWTHLNVRRVVDLIARQVALDAQWAAFEPNDARLWRRLTLLVEQRLVALGTLGAWAGATPAESWFVRCDERTTTAADRDAGRVVVLVGVAPAAPAEFIVFSVALAQAGEGGASDG